MAKYYGVVGFAKTIETSPGVWEEEFVERKYYQDISKNRRTLDKTENLNDNINISNQVSIVGDPYAVNNYFSIRYVEFMGAKWTVSSVDVEYPRLILSLGGLYNA